ncbi:MAG: flagellar basal body protein [Candidatus Eremiobacteraeota bacterium]|nr:flagellar basal body protein [Candidatus Eremiobacteraeota bacterium]
MDGIGWATSAMLSARSRLDIASDNLANAGSDGFRRHLARGLFDGAGSHVVPTASGEQGALRRTGRPFDLALAGAGDFVVVDARGFTSRTRNGSFSRDRFGALSDDAGRRLQGRHGALLVPEGATIALDGTVRKGGLAIDRIALPSGTTVRSGFLESSNVNAIAEMIDMLGAQRSFESAQKVVTAIDATNQKASNELARLK